MTIYALSGANLLNNIHSWHHWKKSSPPLTIRNVKLDRCRFGVGWSTFVHSFLLRSDFVQLQCCQIHISGNWVSAFIVFDEKRAGFIFVWKSGWWRITFLIVREKDWIWFLKDFSIWCASTWWNRFFHNLDLIRHFVRILWQESFVSVIPKMGWKIQRGMYFDIYNRMKFSISNDVIWFLSTHLSIQTKGYVVG